MVSRVLGEIAVRFGQPSLVGELAGGIALGVAVRHAGGSFPVLADLPHDEVFLSLTELGVFFLMLHAGVQMRMSRLVRASGGAALVAIGGMVVPFVGGFVLAHVAFPESPRRLAQSLFLGTALAVTAVPVAIKVLLDLGRLETRLGRTIVSAAVLDDVLSLVLLAVLTALLRTGELPEAGPLAALGARIVGFFLIAAATGRWIFPVVARAVARARSPELELSALLVLGLALALLAERLGMHFLIGAFVAGLYFSRTLVDDAFYEDVETRLSGLTNGLFSPIFFASVGLHLEPSALTAVPGFVALVVGIAIAGKVVGAGAGARLAGHSGAGALAIGIAMSSRGAVELIVADVALQAGLFENAATPRIRHLFSAVVVMAITTTIVAPLLLKPALRREARGSPQPDEAA
ncbi:MAG: cation:proton antiporter [bacterium]